MARRLSFRMGTNAAPGGCHLVRRHQSCERLRIPPLVQIGVRSYGRFTLMLSTLRPEAAPVIPLTAAGLTGMPLRCGVVDLRAWAVELYSWPNFFSCGCGRECGAPRL
ncbi:hypothetical protein TraAM80_10437 [Trypanosoma rangeli]|uniref:Uncharacterized protein n=1 Tax=Trypanosoma rangeli TaxID=5698 RepID=A0A3R7LWN9_TRYRA|nr:uncharacterized protein TraAM80_10437 [Trypanosoma rangeli]RNE95039.1 hypothetical protein TraAM80_10437 [Trypanosoma rangeli]|eukprot:RNE95039.1 hypothetical protein TraAM80_10437 [Trypanosoma rangeli]